MDSGRSEILIYQTEDGLTRIKVDDFNLDVSISALRPNSSHWVIDIRPVNTQNASEETW
jgi:hypothetical protein